MLLAWTTGCSEPTTPASLTALENETNAMDHSIESIKIDPEDLRWETRPLVLLADQPDNPLLADQLSALAKHAEPMSERRMIVIRIVGHSVQVGLGPNAPQIASSGLAARWRQVVEPEPGVAFQAALVGLDGGVKLTAEQPVSFERLRRLIDSMPMRQAEMRREAE
ncbi:MAG: DUF4174 domain-containing protein [Planctomycetota bacterium]